MADSLVNQSVLFGAVTYDSDDCIQNTGLTWDKEDITYYCSGAQKHLAGTTNAVFTMSLALDQTDTAKCTALAPGSTGVWEWHPGGDTPTYIEYESTKGTVLSGYVAGGDPNTIMQLDVSIALDDILVQAAT